MGNVTKAGDVIRYRIDVTNNGKTDLTNVTVNDSLINLTGPTESLDDDGILDAGENWTYTGNYTITQTDINSNGTGTGFINNTATVSCDQLDPKSASAQVPLEWRPDFTIFKSAIRVDESGDCIIDASKDIIEYRIVVKNDGNVDINNLVVNDSLINLTGPVGNNTEIEILSPGDTWEYTGNYTVTRDDINNKKFINNTAIVSSAELPEKNSSVSQPIVSKTGLTLYKSVIGIDEVGDRIINTPGDMIQYQVAVKNNGNVKLTGFSINDPMVNLTKSSGNSDMLDELLPGELRVYTGNYTVTQQDMENIPGIINNTVVASSNQLPNESSSLELPVVHTLFTVVASEPESSNILPIANFSANVTGGYAPLTVQFI